MHPFRCWTAQGSSPFAALKACAWAILVALAPATFVAPAWAQVGAKSKTKAAAEADANADPALPEPATVEIAMRVLDLREFPTMEGAVIQGARRLGQLGYQAKASPKLAFEFQRRNLLERGWKEASGSQIDAAYATGQFGKAGFLVYVFTSEVAGDPAKAGWSQVMVVNYGNVLTGSLPAPPDAKSFYPDATAAAYLTEATIPETSEACRTLLLAESWEPYGTAGNRSDSAILFFKKNAIRLRVWISTAPAEGNKTVIRYSTELLSADIPAPPDAPDPRYDDAQKVVSFDWPDENPSPVFAFYRKALARQTWSPTTEQPVTDARKKKEFQIYRNPRGEMMSVDIEQFTGISRVRVQNRSVAEVAELDRKAAEEAARFAREKEAEKKPAAPPETSPKVAARSRKKADEKDASRSTKSLGDMELPEVRGATKLFEDLDREIEQTLQAPKKAAKPARKTKATPVEKPPKSAPSGPAKVAEIPVPKDAEKIERSQTTQMITFASPTEVKALAAFYLDDLKEKGWEKGAGVLVTEESAILKLAKGDAGLTIFINRGESTSDVTVMTRGVEWETRPTADATAKVDAPSQPKSPDPPVAQTAPSTEEPQDEPKKERPAVPAEDPPVAKKSTPPAEKPAESPNDEPPSVEVDRKPGVDQKQGDVNIWIDDKRHPLAYGVAFRTKTDDKPKTEVLLSEKPIAVDKLLAALREGKGEADVFDFERCMKLRFDEAGKLEYLFLYADGLSINLGNPKPELVRAEIAVRDGHARGKAVMEQPEKFFKQTYRIDATFDAKLIYGGEPSEPASRPSAEPEPGAIIANEAGGLPFPQENTERTSTSTPFRKTVSVVTALEMEPLVEFYRRELTARGWNEVADSADIDAKKSTLSFNGPEGELQLLLSQKDEQVHVLIASRSRDKAQAAGILPQPNRGRIMLANSQNQEAQLTINGQPYKLAAGLGTKAPREGKILNVLPGRYRLVIKVRGETDKPQDINVRLDETWGVMILPTGGIVIDQIY